MDSANAPQGMGLVVVQSEAAKAPVRSLLTGRDTAAAAALAAVSLCVYIATLCPTVFTDDCGEIATAVMTQGVMHPPGYPLYTLIGGLFMHLISIGEPAWRLGLFSALSASGAVAGTFLLARRAGAPPVWAAASALAFAFSLSLWRQAVKVETYALNALFVSLIFNAAARYHETGSRRNLVLAALICGLALTNHLTVICAIAGAGWLILGRWLQSSAGPPNPCKRGTLLPRLQELGGALAAFSLPLCLYGLIWWNAARHPGGQIWGDPSNWQGFLLHVTGARYHEYFGALKNYELAIRDLYDLPARLWRNLGPFLILIVPGVARGLLAGGIQRRLMQGMLITAAAYLLETSVYGIFNIFEYYTPLIMLLCVWAGVGGEALQLGLTSRLAALASRVRLLPACACAVVAFASLLAHWGACDLQRATYMRDLALNTLNTLPPNTVLITIGDNRTFPIAYAQNVLGVRRDVTVVYRHSMDSYDTAAGRAEMGWLVEKMQHDHPGIVNSAAILQRSTDVPGYARGEGALWDIAAGALSAHHPLFSTCIFPSDTHAGPGGWPVFTRLRPDLTYMPAGLCDQVIPITSVPSPTELAKRNLEIERSITIGSASRAQMEDEPDGNFTNLTYAAMLQRTGLLLSAANDPADAYPRLMAARELAPDEIDGRALDLVRARAAQLALDNPGATRDQGTKTP